MKRTFRLTRSTDIKRVRRGKSFAHPLIVLAIARNDLYRPRVGVVAGHRVGGAVQRNRAKRRIRMVMHALLPRLKPGFDLILIARQPVVEARFSDIETVIAGLVKRAGLFVEESNDRERTPA